MTPSILELPWLPLPPADFADRCRAIGVECEPAGPEIQRLAGTRLSSRQSLTLARAIERCRTANTDRAPLSLFRLGILASATYDLLPDYLPAAAARHGIDVEVVMTPFDQVMQQALDPCSIVNASGLDAVLIAVDHRWFRLDSPMAENAAPDHITASIARLRDVIDAIRLNSSAPCIIQSLATPPTSLFGNFDRRVSGTIRTMIDSVNRSIVALADDTGSYLLDVAAIAERVGTDRWFDPVQWASYKLPFLSDCFPIYSDMIGRLMSSIRGKARKCLVLDLDNTLWGGVIGDDGLGGIIIGQGDPRGEAFLAVQQLARALRNRGVILAVCSKNDDAVARLPFRDHPEMVLKESDFAVFQANWDDKPSNLEAIAKKLNIGMDALVFLDDNPAERAQMRAALPMVAVPELPADPNWYSWYLTSAGYFEAVGFTDEDRIRAASYAAEAQRAEVLVQSRDLGDYLASLQMVIQFASFDHHRRKRIAQLINKTNQFNLTTRRYTEAQVALIETDRSLFAMQASLVDRFGDLGMIGVVICRPRVNDPTAWEIDTWLMSCRVLGRQVEQAMLNAIVEEARQRKITRLIGCYIPTGKNGMVAEHFSNLGFTRLDDMGDSASNWKLNIPEFSAPDLPMTVRTQYIEAVSGS